ncbi:MAG: stage II sporulation protein M [Clostridiales bacterium]|nr:stage II sporulation protein M [Clostridiales bacterium]
MLEEEAFIQKNKTSWEKLDEYNRRLERKRVSSFSSEELREFADLFRKATRNLAYAKTRYPNGKTTAYLNRLAGMSHQHFYAKEKGAWADAAGYFTSGFPQMAREYQEYFLASMLLFFIGVMVSIALTATNPIYFAIFLPQSTIDAVGGGVSGVPVSLANYSMLGAVIMTNNIRVSFEAFALGLTAGLGTIYIIFYNGAVLGATTGLFMSRGANMAIYFGTLLPHAFIELAAIFLSGACGLMIGKAILLPGRLSRKDALVLAAKRAAGFIPGILVMLAAAALIEGFFSPLPVSPPLKLAFAFATLAALAFYFVRAGYSKS